MTKNGGMGIGRKVMIGCIAVLLFLAAGAYAYGVYYFSVHFLPGSYVNSFNCSYMTVQEAEQLLGEKIGAYALAVRTRGNGQEGITAEQMGLSYHSTGAVQDLIKHQNRFLWFLSFGQNQQYNVAEDLIYDEEKLDAAVDGMDCMQSENITQPVDAQIRDNGESFEIVAEVEGNALDPLKVRQVIAQAALTGETSVDLEQEACYLRPGTYSDDEQLIRNCEQMNAWTQGILTYDFADRTETVDRTVVSTWFGYDEEGNVCLDQELVSNYVEQLAATYDTVGTTRTFLTYDNREKTIEGGDYGWKMDCEAETASLLELVKSGATQVREPFYEQSGYSRASNDIGDTYIEIDLTNQRLVFYKDGQPLVDTLVVSGNPNIEGGATPTGCYTLTDKQSPCIHTAEGLGQVSYWMGFAEDLGIHDAQGRTQFGDGLYIWEGSEGCVEMPYEQAAALYAAVETGMPVVLYE